MAPSRMIVLAALCLSIGCRTVDSGAISYERPARIGPPADQPRQLIAPVSLTSVLSDPANASPQPIVHVQPADTQPAETAAPPEPILPLPAPDSSVAPGELTLAAIEEMALAANPALAEAQARVDAARGKWVQVGLPPNTVLGYSGQQLGSRGLAEQQGIYISQEWVRGGKLHLNRAVVAEEIAMAEQQLAAQQQRVLTDVRLGFYEVLIAQRRIELTEELLGIANQGIETAEALFRAQEVSQVDVIRARIELQTASLLNKNSRNLHAAAWSRLTAVLGTDIGPTLLIGDLQAVDEYLDQDEALQRLVNESPEMAVALTEVELARWAIDRAYAEPVPNVDVQAVFQSDNGTGSSNGNLQVSLPIPWLNRNQGGIREAEANLFAAERAVSRIELDLKQRLASVYQQYASARNQVRDYAKTEGILANSETALELVRGGYQAGESSYLDLLTAQRTFSQTNLTYLEALGELWSATIEIEGLLLKGSLANSGR